MERATPERIGTSASGGGRPLPTSDPLERRLIVHDGYIDPSFQRKLGELCPGIKVFWNHVLKRWVFYRRAPHRTGLGSNMHWHDPANWYGGESNSARREALRAALCYDLGMRAKGWQPIFQHGPEEGPLNEMVILSIALGDGQAGQAIKDLQNRITKEVIRSNDIKRASEKVDTDMFKAAMQADDSPYKGVIDLDAKDKLYRDDKAQEEGMPAAPFTQPAAKPKVSVSVPGD